MAVGVYTYVQNHLVWTIYSHELFYSFFAFLGLHLKHMEVPRLEVESKLQLLAYTTATAMPDP